MSNIGIDISNTVQSGDPGMQVLMQAVSTGSLDGAIDQSTSQVQQQAAVFALKSATSESKSEAALLMSKLTGLGNNLDTIA